MIQTHGADGYCIGMRILGLKIAYRALTNTEHESLTFEFNQISLIQFLRIAYFLLTFDSLEVFVTLSLRLFYKMNLNTLCQTIRGTYSNPSDILLPHNTNQEWDRKMNTVLLEHILSQHTTLKQKFPYNSGLLALSG